LISTTVWEPTWALTTRPEVFYPNLGLVGACGSLHRFGGEAIDGLGDSPATPDFQTTQR
jgi:hypothetical protein